MYARNGLNLAAVTLANAGKALLGLKAYAEAEPLLRESLSLREKENPDWWETHNLRSLVGAALLGQEKYAEAEPLLAAGYAGMKEREAHGPSEARARRGEVLGMLVRLYDAWGKPDEAARWRNEMAAR